MPAAGRGIGTASCTVNAWRPLLWILEQRGKTQGEKPFSRFTSRCQVLSQCQITQLVTLVALFLFRPDGRGASHQDHGVVANTTNLELLGHLWMHALLISNHETLLKCAHFHRFINCRRRSSTCLTDGSTHQEEVCNQLQGLSLGGDLAFRLETYNSRQNSARVDCSTPLIMHTRSRRQLCALKT